MLNFIFYNKKNNNIKSNMQSVRFLKHRSPENETSVLRCATLTLILQVKFRSGNKSLDNDNCSRPPTAVDDTYLKPLVEKKHRKKCARTCCES